MFFICIVYSKAVRYSLTHFQACNMGKTKSLKQFEWGETVAGVDCHLAISVMFQDRISRGEGRGRLRPWGWRGEHSRDNPLFSRLEGCRYPLEHNVPLHSCPRNSVYVMHCGGRSAVAETPVRYQHLPRWCSECSRRWVTHRFRMRLWQLYPQWDGEWHICSEQQGEWHIRSERDCDWHVNSEWQ
jgi:hypothetical protein